MIHDCSIVGIQVDAAALFYGEDPHYFYFLYMAARRVNATKRKAEKDG